MGSREYIQCFRRFTKKLMIPITKLKINPWKSSKYVSRYFSIHLPRNLFDVFSKDNINSFTTDFLWNFFFSKIFPTKSVRKFLSKYLRSFEGSLKAHIYKFRQVFTGLFWFTDFSRNTYRKPFKNVIKGFLQNCIYKLFNIYF